MTHTVLMLKYAMLHEPCVTKIGELLHQSVNTVYRGFHYYRMQLIFGKSSFPKC